MENILITGAAGQLGSELKNAAPKNPGYTCFFTDAEELDITDRTAVEQYLDRNKISKIINCAAYNNVDKAETESDAAIRINIMGPAILAEAAAARDLYLIHFSSDYVYDGEKKTPYHESDRPAPLSEYGKSKLGGEVAIKKSGCRSIIIRTAWLYSPYGNNFVKKMISLGYSNDGIRVVNDQVGTPTSAKDLAEAVFHILPQLDNMPRYGEVFNYTDEGHCSWAEFAAKIMKDYRLECEIIPITTEEYDSPAARPKRSVLDKDLIRKTFGVVTPQWERSLLKTLRRIELMEEQN